MVRCSYKLVVKTLATRLNIVMIKIISLSQTTFIKGKLLVGGVVVVNKLVDMTKKEKENIIYRVDFEKDYDLQLELPKFYI